MQLHWTRFEDPLAKVKRDITQTWSEFIEHLKGEGPHYAKLKCPMLKFAIFGDEQSESGCYRTNENLVSVTGLEGDYDGGLVSPEQAITMLERHGIRAVVYTSYSHTEEAPRWRVVTPLARPASPAEREWLMSRLNGALGGVLAGESFTLSQSYFYGFVKGRPFTVLTTWDDSEEGGCVDELDDLDTIAIGKANQFNDEPNAPHVSDIAAKSEHLGRRLQTGDGRRELLKSHIAKRSNMGLSPEEVEALARDVVARYFDPADPVDWKDIRSIIISITSKDASERKRVASVVDGFINKAKQSSKQATPPPGLEFMDLLAVYANDPPDLHWVMDGWISKKTVTTLYGKGGVGKSLLSLQIGVSVALGQPLFGIHCKGSRVLALYCEDDQDEIHRRLHRMAHSAKFSIADIAAGFDMSARAGMDNTIITAGDADATIKVTSFLQIIRARLQTRTYDLLILDNIAQMIAVPENKRAVVTQAVNVLTQLAIEFDVAILLLGHPAKGIDSEFSGSTAWDAAVRSRLLFERIDAKDPNSALRLVKAKANYSVRDAIDLRYVDGAYELLASTADMDELQINTAGDAVVSALHHARQMNVELTLEPKSPKRYLCKFIALHGLCSISASDKLVMAAAQKLMTQGVIEEVAALDKWGRTKKSIQFVQ